MGADPISMGLQAAGSIAGAIGQHRQLRAQAAADDENARRTELQGALDEQATRSRERATSGEALSAQGGMGLSVGTGSAWDLLYQNALERERAVLNTRYTAAGEATTLRDKAKSERKAATWALISGVAGAGAKALAQVGELRDRKNPAGAAASVPGGWTMPLPTSTPPTRGGGLWDGP